MAVYGVLMVIYFFAVWDIPESHRAFALRKVLNYRFYIDYYVYWVIVAVAQAVEYYRRYLDQVRRSSLLQQREESLRRQLAEAKLHYLRAQINPHFLFNTLNGVTGQIRKGDSQAAIGLLTGLGDLLRHALDSEQELFVTLAEELKFIGRYLDIQQTRFPDSIQTTIDVDEKALEVLVPGLILQPLIENAIKHGSATEGHTPEIEISGDIRGRWLRVDIVNTIGPGLGEAGIARIVPDDREAREGWGIGLTNTNQRLSIIYGDGYRFDLKPVAEDRVRARILLPAETRLDRLTWTKSEY